MPFSVTITFRFGDEAPTPVVAGKFLDFFKSLLVNVDWKQIIEWLLPLILKKREIAKMLTVALFKASPAFATWASPKLMVGDPGFAAEVAIAMAPTVPTA